MLKMGRVLIVDDEEPIRRSIRRYLCDLPADVQDVGSAREALERLDAFRYEVLVTDYRMPGMDGIELTKVARIRFPETLIVGISSEGVKSEFLAAGASAFLQKPFQREELKEAIQSTLRRR